jgi:hypothetical protein
MATESDVFISYAADTKLLAEQLTQALQTQGFHVWADFKDLRPGQVWRDEIDRALEGARSFVIIVRPTSRAGSWQDTEWRAALTKVWSDSDKRMIPVLVGGTEPPPFLRNWVSLMVDPDAEPANWTRHVVDALLSAPNERVPAPSAASRRERERRFDEIARMAEELRKYDLDHRDLPDLNR